MAHFQRYVATYRGLLAAIVIASTSQGAICRAQTVLDVSTLTKYVDPIANPLNNVLAPTETIDGVPIYDVTVSQFQQQLHSSLPATTLWGYNNSFPGPTLQVDRDSTVNVRWTNNLVDNFGVPLDHILPYDTTVHGAGPAFPQSRISTHVHGAVATQQSDGFPEFWYTGDPNAAANGMGGPAGNTFTSEYTNNQRSAMNWYHDHAMGITRLNVYAGMAGVYMIRDAEEQALGLPSGDYEIPLVFQDRSFYDDGQLFYPAGPGDITSPGVGDPLAGLPAGFPSAASIVPQFLADANLVNGTVWPYMEVEPRKYRFRMLNGANSRFYDLSLEPQPGAATPTAPLFYQIGTDSGLLSTRTERSNLSLSPADRADVVVDFSQFNPGDSILLRNSAVGAQAGTTDEVMEFRIAPLTGPDTSNLPLNLSTINRYQEVDAVKVRTLELVRTFDQYNRLELLLDGKKWTEATSEIIVQGEMEIWEFVNQTGQTHPMHLHMEAFQVLDRTDSGGSDVALEDYELGWEDTVSVGGHETVRIMVRFDQYTGDFVWHCHILEHEDLEMMRTFRIIPQGDANQDGFANGADFLIWQQTLGSTVTSGEGADFSRNGIIDADDLAIWTASYNSAPSPLESASTVPEPSTGTLLALALLITGSRRTSIGTAGKLLRKAQK